MSGLYVESGSLPVPNNIAGTVQNWSDFAIWGLMLHRDQSPWFSVLECLQVAAGQLSAGEPMFPGFDVSAGNHEKLSYSVPLQMNLRHLLFQDQDIVKIARGPQYDEEKWTNWLNIVKKIYAEQAFDFNYLRDEFGEFRGLSDSIELLRSAEIESASRRRWTSRHVLPLGSSMLFPDVDEDEKADKRFFRRTGELMYLMLNRSGLHEELSGKLQERIFGAGIAWNKLAERLQGKSGGVINFSKSTAYLPAARMETYAQLGQDWLSLLTLEAMPIEYALDALMRISGLHLCLYILERSQAVAGIDQLPPILLDLSGSARDNPIYVTSRGLFEQHRNIPPLALNAFIRGYEDGEEWGAARSGATLDELRALIEQRFMFRTKRQSSHSDTLIQDLLKHAHKSLSLGPATAYGAYGKGIGLLCARKRSGTWYSPNDRFLEALVYANVRGPLELDEFKARLWSRYRIIVGTSDTVVSGLGVTVQALRNNERHFERRLRTLGLLDRKSDDCAFVVNPFNQG